MDDASTPPHLHLVLIDDSPADRILFHDRMFAPGKPFMRNVSIDYLSKPLENLADYHRYDGVMLDQRLGHVLGTEIAEKINFYDWRIPVAVITGESPDWLPYNIRDYVDGVAFKHGASRHRIDDEQGVLRAWMRQIARAKLLRLELEALRAS